MSEKELEERLAKIEATLDEINEAFQTIKSGMKALEFLGKCTKHLLFIFSFCGIAWGVLTHYFKR